MDPFRGTLGVKDRVMREDLMDSILPCHTLGFEVARSHLSWYVYRLVCRHIGSRSVGDTLRRSSLKKQKMRSVQMCSTEWARMELLIFSTHMITPMTLLYMDLETEEHPSASSLSEFDDQFKAQRIIPT